MDIFYHTLFSIIYLYYKIHCFSFTAEQAKLDLHAAAHQAVKEKEQNKLEACRKIVQSLKRHHHKTLIQSIRTWRICVFKMETVNATNELNKTIKKKKKKIKKLMEENATCTATMEQQVIDIGVLTEDRDGLMISLTETKVLLNETKGYLKDVTLELKEATDLITELETQIEQLEEEKEDLLTLKEENEEEISDLQTKIKNNKQKSMSREAKLRGRLEKMTNDWQSSEQKITKLQKMGEENVKTIQMLERKITNIENHVVKLKNSKVKEQAKCKLLMSGVVGFASTVLKGSVKEKNVDQVVNVGDPVPEINAIEIKDEKERAAVAASFVAAGRISEEKDGISSVSRWQNAWRKTVFVSAKKQRKVTAMVTSNAEIATDATAEDHIQNIEEEEEEKEEEEFVPSPEELLSDLDLEGSKEDRQEGEKRMTQIQNAIQEFMSTVQTFQMEYKLYLQEWHDPSNENQIKRVVPLGSVNFHPVKLSSKIRPSILKGSDMLRRRLKTPNRYQNTRRKNRSGSGTRSSGGRAGMKSIKAMGMGETNMPIRAMPCSPPPNVGIWQGTSVEEKDNFLLSPMEMNGRIGVPSGSGSAMLESGGSSLNMY